MLRSKRLPAYPVYLATAGCWSMFFAMLSTVSGVFQVEAAHLNPLQLVLVGTALEASTFVFEVPTGVVADVYSRRLSVVIGIFLTGCGFLLWGAFTRFWTILLAQVVWGIGYTFTSGATEAWIADEVGEERAGPAFLRAAQASQVGALGGIVLSAVLASMRLSLPLIVGGLSNIGLAIFLALSMPETGFRPVAAGQRSSRQSMAGTLRASVRTVRAKPVLITILLIAAIYGATSEGFDRLNVALLLNDLGLPSFGRFDPVVWFAVISAGGLLFSLVAAEVVRRRLDTASHFAVAAYLSAINALLIVTVAAFALAGNFATAVAAMWATALLRRTNGPLRIVWINQSLEPAVRATVFSLASQADALGQILGGPLLGLIATVFSVRAGIGAAAFFLIPALPLYARTMRRPAPVPAEAGGVEPR